MVPPGATLSKRRDPRGGLLGRRTGAVRHHAVVQLADDLPVTVFVAIKTSQHTAAWLERFAKGVTEIPEVIEFYRMSGDIDYLLRVVVPDIGGYDAVYKKLIRIAELSDVSSSFAMEQIKYTTAFPLDYAE